MKYEFSAGGVVFKNISGKTEVLVCKHSRHHGWVFPKGFIGDKKEGETKEETAAREVKEETGITAKILKPLKPVTYWYKMDDERHKKTVYYFLMEYVSGDTKQHDFEMENVEWLPEDQVEERLTYESDRKVWKVAQERLKRLALREKL